MWPVLTSTLSKHKTSSTRIPRGSATGTPLQSAISKLGFVGSIFVPSKGCSSSSFPGEAGIISPNTVYPSSPWVAAIRCIRGVPGLTVMIAPRSFISTLPPAVACGLKTRSCAVEQRRTNLASLPSFGLRPWATIALYATPEAFSNCWPKKLSSARGLIPFFTPAWLSASCASSIVSSDPPLAVVIVASATIFFSSILIAIVASTALAITKDTSLWFLEGAKSFPILAVIVSYSPNSDCSNISIN